MKLEHIPVETREVLEALKIAGAELSRDGRATVHRYGAEDIDAAIQLARTIKQKIYGHDVVPLEEGDSVYFHDEDGVQHGVVKNWNGKQVTVVWDRDGHISLENPEEMVKRAVIRVQS